MDSYLRISIILVLVYFSGIPLKMNSCFVPLCELVKVECLEWFECFEFSKLSSPNSAFRFVEILYPFDPDILFWI